MVDDLFDGDRVATIKIAMDNDLTMLLDRVAELYALNYTEAATLAFGIGLASLESAWGRELLRKLRVQGAP